MQLSLVSPTCLTFWLNLLFHNRVDKNLIARGRLCMHGPLAPIITARIGKQVTLLVKGGARNSPLNRGKALEALLIIFVPKVHHACQKDKMSIAVSYQQHLAHMDLNDTHHHSQP